MKKIITILLIAFFTNNLSAQDNKGNLLLEGNLIGTSWSEISISGNNIGYYITDKIALNTGYVIGLVESDLFSMNFGARFHSWDNVITYVDMYFASDEYGEVVLYSGELGVKTRYYVTKWMSIDPGVGMVIADDYGTTFLMSRLGFSLHFSKN
jgi:hypothetical protein